MTPVTQTITGDKGNCLQAAVASILDKPLEEVPHFICYGESWFIALILFMRDFGYEYHGIADGSLLTDPKFNKGIGGYVIGSGMSPRGFSHAVVCKDGEIVHDPHPSRAGVEHIESFYQFEPFGETREELNWIIR